MYWSASETKEVPVGVVTVTSTVPFPGGTTATMVVGDSTEKLSAGVDPKETALTSTKFVPVIVIELPPIEAPELEERPVTVGGPKYVEEAWII